MNPSKKALVLALSAAFAQVSYAANETALPEVMVTAEKLQPLPSTGNQGLDPDSLSSKRVSTSDTASLLKDVPGVSLYGAGGVSSLPVIHGLADDRLRIKVDGMDLISSCPNHMNSPLSYLDPTQVGAIKVYAGITPVSVGGDSIGGTILANTAAPEFAAEGQENLIKGQVGAFYRSNGDARGANLSATLASETMSMTYSGSTAQADNYEAGDAYRTSAVTGRPGHLLPLDEVGSTAYKSKNHSLNFALRNVNHLFEAKLGYQDIPYELYPNQRMDMLDNIQHRYNLRYFGQFDWGALDTRIYHETVRHFMDFGADKRFWYGSNSGAGATGSPCSPIRFQGDALGTCAGGMPMYTEGETTGVTAKADIILSTVDTLRVGGEYQRYRLDDWWPASGGGMGPYTFWNIKDGERDRTALFAEWETQKSKQWLTQLGVRFEQVKSDTGAVHGYNLDTFPINPLPAGNGNQTRDAANFNNASRDRTDNNWDMTALARYTPSITQDIEFGFARKVRSPNLYERYTWSTWAMAATMNNFVGDGNGYVGNPNLEPEKAHTLSATFDWHAADRSWEVKATPYYTRVSDYIDAVKSAAFTANQFNVINYANQSARLYGLDLSGHMPLMKNAAGEFGVNGLLNYTDGKNRDTGDDLYNIMPLNAKVTLTQKFGRWNNGIELVMVKDKQDISDVRNEIRTPGYGLVNLRAGYGWKQASINLGIENLFDKSYFLPLGGAYTGQGRTMSMNPADGTMSWGTAVPGMGRSINVGANVKF